MFLAARSWGLSPSEFWSMTIPEYYAELEWRAPAEKTHAGKLTDEDVEELKAYLNGTS